MENCRKCKSRSLCPSGLTSWPVASTYTLSCCRVGAKLQVGNAESIFQWYGKRVHRNLCGWGCEDAGRAQTAGHTDLRTKTFSQAAFRCEIIEYGILNGGQLLSLFSWHLKPYGIFSQPVGNSRSGRFSLCYLSS